MTGLLLRALVAVALVAPSWGGTPPPPPVGESVPAVQVVAFFDPMMSYSASLAYSDATVTKEQALADLTALAKALSYEGLADLRPNDEKGEFVEPQFVVKDGVAQCGFRLSERALNREQGTFKLEAFIDAFRRYRRVDFNFDVGQLGGKVFGYTGLGDYEDRNVRIRHHGAGTSHEFVVEVLNPNYTKLDLPPHALPVAPLEGTARGHTRPSKGTWLAVLVGALGCGAITFVVLSYALTRRRLARRRGR